MNMTHLRYFLAVAETGNFTRAAERINVTQPTLSIGLKRLEESLGQRLINRGRIARLTAAGVRFLPRARLITQEWAAAKSDLASSGKSRLHLGFVRTLGPQAIANLLRDARAADPDRLIDLTDGDAAGLARLLDRSEIDLAILHLDETTGRHHHRLPLWRERYALAVPPSHPLAGRTVCRLADLHGMAFVMRPESEAIKELRRAMAAGGIDCPITARLSDESRLPPLVNAGIGLAWLPEALIPPQIPSLSISDFSYQPQLGLLWRRAANAAVEPLAKLIQSHPWHETDRSRLDAAH